MRYRIRQYQLNCRNKFDLMGMGLLITALFVIMLLPSYAQSAELFRINDIAGDDHGAGDIVYPGRDDFVEGDLDLRWIKAESAKNGTWFVAKFAKPIRSPAGRPAGLGPEQLDRYARLGFYTFNIDMYIDTDRIPGSGNTNTLPGRRVEIDSSNAWEKSIILTPRPREAQTLLEGSSERALEAARRAEKGRVTAAELEQIRASVNAEIKERFFFPINVKIRKDTIRYFVPTSFLGEKASGDWSYTIFVTGADVEQQTQFGNYQRGSGLMIIPVSMGRPRDSFGLVSDADSGQPPVIDLANPDAQAQQSILSDYDTVAGRLVRLTGVVPNSKAMAIKPQKVITKPDNLTQVQPQLDSKTPTDPDADKTGTQISTEMAPRAVTVDEMLANQPNAPSYDEKKPIAERLRTLNELKTEGLITEQEFQQLRRKVLSDI